MDKPKTEVVKSKSISTSEPKNNNQKHNKKSRSNAEFKPLLLKKRGVYVEKKPVSINNRERSPDSVLVKQQSSCVRPSPPRPGRKRFVASVLSILSKSTAGTQCPDNHDNIKTTVNKLNITKTEDVIEEASTPPERKKHRHRIRDKSKSSVSKQPLPLVVLQSSKEITHTSSSYSVVGNKKGSVNKDLDRVNVNLTEALPQKVKKHYLNTVSLEDTGVNLIEKINGPTKETESSNKDDKHMYNFFVDLLKTTFSVYNVQTECKQAPPTSKNSSDVELEIDECVAQKLNIETANTASIETCGMCLSQKPSFDFSYSIRPDDKQHWDNDVLVDEFSPKYNKKYSEEPTKAPVKRKRQLKSESFYYRKTQNKKLFTNISSVATPNKTNKKKSKKIPKKNIKRDFLNELKEQLQMKTEQFKEPQNFFEALKVIARNKKRCQKSVSHKMSKKSSEGDMHVCQFKTRRVLSAKSSGKQTTHPENHYGPRTPYPMNLKRRTPIIRITETSDSESGGSNHSLTVAGYDFEPRKVIKLQKFDDNDFFMLPMAPSNFVPDDEN